MSAEENRRHHPRAIVQQIVALTSSTCTGDKAALTEDISLGGALVRTNSCVAEGSQVSLVVALPVEITRSSEVCVVCRGRVLRREERGTRAVVAVEFSHYDFLPQTAAQENAMEAELTNLEKEFAQAIVSNDVKAMEPFLAADWVIINGKRRLSRSSCSSYSVLA